LERRYQKFRRMGVYEELAAMPPTPKGPSDEPGPNGG